MRTSRSGLLILFVMLAAVVAHGSFTIATFADPSSSSGQTLFLVDWGNDSISGEWNQPGLTLEMPYTGQIFNDVWFSIGNLEIVDQKIFWGMPFGETSGGQINFYEAGNSENELLTVRFSTAYISVFGLGSEEKDELIALDIEIVSPFLSTKLSQGQFSFSFVNRIPLADGDGFTSSAAFNLSAVPEPASIALLSMGVLGLVRRKRTAK